MTEQDVKGLIADVLRRLTAAQEPDLATEMRLEAYRLDRPEESTPTKFRCQACGHDWKAHNLGPCPQCVRRYWAEKPKPMFTLTPTGETADCPGPGQFYLDENGDVWTHHDQNARYATPVRILKLERCEE